MTKVLFAAAEAAPFFKTGGLGDVAYALPRALNAAGDDVRVVVPYYSELFPAKYKDRLVDLANFEVHINGQNKYAGIKTLNLDGITYYFIDNVEYFGRDQLYDFWDDGERYAFFQLAIIEMMQVIDFIPRVIHVNDWHTAFIPVLLRTKFHWVGAFKNIKTMLTIHNLMFQGYFPPVILDSLFDMGQETFRDDRAKAGDMLNWLKGGINYADAVNTVSPTYAQEIMTPEFGEGLDGVLRNVSYKVSGIMNGIDTKLYNPMTDTALPAPYSATDLSGKAVDKAALQAEVGLPVRDDVPVFAMVSRLTDQKGVDILMDTMHDFLSRHDAQVIILGTGFPDLEQRVQAYQTQFPDQFVGLIAFDVNLAQRIYAGADAFLMPSKFEPSGLSQMVAMHYGTLPIAHLVGGLRDTVDPFNPITGEGTGFGFDRYSSVVLGEILAFAFRTFMENQPAWQQLMQTGMARDFDWANSAKIYAERYMGI
ncbi:glycogen synthase GlgA [Periweissella cryptocerci]|uniref:Glycogen synthase n=1 Tax=Periweissella cryptocerci TaxID=2506420 RepID=A0A4P6YUA8_9LACO|nr:glycogen synthase GlgA [Periweissella cryptocerci]QBO36358.1 glycogen synthase GlgA [Periweissella cryptocerci]